MDDLGEHISFLMDSESDDNENIEAAAAFDHLGHPNGLGHDEYEEELEDEEIEEDEEEDFDAIDFGIQERIRQAQHLSDDLEPEELEDDEEEEEEDGELSEEDPLAEESNNHYDSACFSHLRVGSDVSALFKFIDAYKPLDIDIETQLKPFTYDYIPGMPLVPLDVICSYSYSDCFS